MGQWRMQAVPGIRQVLRGQLHFSKEERNRLLVPLTGSGSDSQLLKYVTRIAHRKNSDITLMYVVEVDQELPLGAELPSEVKQGEKVLNDARDLLKKALDSRSSFVSTDLLQARFAGAAIVDEAVQDGVDAIVMGATVKKRLGVRTIGETVEYVMQNAPCEVVILRGAMSDSLLRELEMEIE